MFNDFYVYNQQFLDEWEKYSKCIGRDKQQMIQKKYNEGVLKGSLNADNLESFYLNNIKLLGNSRKNMQKRLDYFRTLWERTGKQRFDGINEYLVEYEEGDGNSSKRLAVTVEEIGEINIDDLGIFVCLKIC